MAGPERRSPGTRERLRGARAVPEPRAPSRRLPAAAAPAPPPRPGPAMPRLFLLLFIFLVIFLLVPHLGLATTPSPGNRTEPPRAAAGNETQTESGHESRPRLSVGSGLPVLRRAVYVLSALSALAALYFVLRAFRPRSEGSRNEPKTHFRLKPQRKKYGLLSSQDESIELGSLDSDEDTVFETRNLRR